MYLITKILVVLIVNYLSIKILKKLPLILLLFGSFFGLLALAIVEIVNGGF
jgi:hypothetical protein